MADLSTTYLGMNLRSPFVPSASPISEDINKIRHMEDAGAAAVVLHSLFEEQLVLDRLNREMKVEFGARRNPFPSAMSYAVDPVGYLEHIRKAKEVVEIPIIASLNCRTTGGWVEFAKQIQQAGADALELNIYRLSTDMYETGAQVEREAIEIVEDVRSQINLPLAVKLSPYYSNMANMAWRMERAGADALVLFNRFYQPDINLDSMQVTSRILLSTPQAMRLPLRWIAILYGNVHTDLAASGGIHEPYEVAKMLLAGANVTMLCSVLLRRGIDYIGMLETEFVRWLDEHNFESVSDMRGKMSQQDCPSTAAFERAQYIRTLRSYGRVSPWSRTPVE